MQVDVHLPISGVCVTLVSEVSILMEAAITVRMSVRPPARFTEKTDWSLCMDLPFREVC